MKKINKKGSFVIVEIIFILLILLGMLIIKDVADYYETTTIISKYVQQNTEEEASDSNDESSALINSLVSMQANTLTVTAIIITISSIIISVLTIYRERKAEINSERVDQSIQKLNNSEKMTQELAAISSIVLLDDEQQEVFIPIIRQKIEKLTKVGEDSNIAYAHFQMILMNLALYDQHYLAEKNKPNKQNDYVEYDYIIKKANKIIKDDESTQLSRDFAYIERVHAAFQKLKNSTESTDTEKKRKNIQSNINDAHKYLKDLKKQKLNDSNGHIVNLTGLIELWTGIAKTRIYENSDNGINSIELISHYEEAKRCFTVAIEKNRKKVGFKNHMVVALLRLADIVGEIGEKNNYLDEAKKICIDINNIHPYYLKSQVNLADTIARQIRVSLNISNFWDEEVEHFIFDYRVVNVSENEQKQMKENINDAIAALKRAKDIDETFANSYYKMVEIYTLELCVSLCNLSEQEIKKITNDIDQNLKEAIKITSGISKIYIYEYSYLRLMQNYYDEIIEKEIDDNKKIELLEEKQKIEKRKNDVVEQIKKRKLK